MYTFVPLKFLNAEHTSSLLMFQIIGRFIFYFKNILLLNNQYLYMFLLMCPFSGCFINLNMAFKAFLLGWRADVDQNGLIIK